MKSEIDITSFLHIVADYVRDKQVPVVDLIAVQTRDPFKVLVATILSARTKDETTAKAASRLFKKAETPEALAKLSVEELEKLIHPVGFFRNKAKYLAQLPQSLKQFGDKVPDTIEDLIQLPGVGRKTANLVRSVAFAKPAICVDTHVHRIMNIWCYVDTDTPLKTEMALRAKLPEKHWITVNSILVAFGQSLCKPVRPHCDICPLQGACPQNGVTPRSVKASSKRTEKHNGQPLKLISWNVNGIRAVEKKGFAEIVADLDADILALQETKAHPDQLSDKLKDIDGYTSYWHSAEKKGYSGVAVYTRQEPLKVIEGLGIEEFDREGRVLTLEFDSYYLTNIYFPNAGEGLKRLEFKIAFNHALLAFTDNLKKQKHVVLCGDFNVAHKPIDLKNPASNTQNAGFTQDERDWMDSFIEAGYLDTFRMFNQDPEQYTWWSYRFNARAKNIGWRIDYFCVDSAGATRVQNAEILPEILGSDHCPVVLHWAS
ncbi:exodeoxyribonuclease III [Desulfosediminicola sp.]|uniref:exodeoxyribonuclease III n=1 Tax=Desulfosediminicola sp. TaxID=2886825 RepID=UPI003AF209BB